MSDRITTLDENLLSLIFSFLTAKDLCQLAITCKSFATSGQHISMEMVWKALVDKRFGLNDRTRKTVGANNQKNMKDMYSLLHYRKQIPDGKFTSKQNFVFGKGQTQGILAWLVVAPSTNAILRPVSHQGQIVHKMELRFCIQNIQHEFVKLSVSEDFVSIECIASEDIKDGRLHTSSFRLLSKNGQIANPSTPSIESSMSRAMISGESTSMKQQEVGEDVLTLRLLDYAVISCQVYCPDSVESEPDLLTMLTKLEFHFKASQVSHNMDVDVAVIRMTDEEVWSQYVSLPSGVVMLRDKSVNDWK